MIEIRQNMIQQLIAEAQKARQNAYCPYSHYAVGAALLTKEGRIFRGCNVENASYGATNCAERSALFAAVSEGYRGFTAIALVAGPVDEQESGRQDSGTAAWPTPCGICRQALREFVDPAQFMVIAARSAQDWRTMTLEELLPESFGPDFLNS